MWLWNPVSVISPAPTCRDLAVVPIRVANRPHPFSRTALRVVLGIFNLPKPSLVLRNHLWNRPAVILALIIRIMFDWWWFETTMLDVKPTCSHAVSMLLPGSLPPALCKMQYVQACGTFLTPATEATGMVIDEALPPTRAATGVSPSMPGATLHQDCCEKTPGNHRREIVWNISWLAG